jgi:uncharacterized membrane protein
MPPEIPNLWDWIQLIFTALGLSTTAGLRAYLPLLAVALGSTDPSLTDIHLSPGFQWMGSTWFMIIVGALAFVEFGVDKAPGLDHVSDIVHTVIRPISGAIIMAGVENPISHWNPWVAAVIGGVLALTAHGIKSATRPVVTATTVGVGNPVLSIGEDIGALISTILAIFLPIIGVIVLAVALLLFARPISRGLRSLFGWDRSPATAVGSSGEPDQTLPGV